MKKQTGTKTNLTEKQKIFLKHYFELRGHISNACKETGIGRTQYYRWLDNEKFRKAFEDTLEAHNDSVMQRILVMAETGDKEMLKFWAKNQMKHRGWVEKQELEVTGNVTTLTDEQCEEAIKRLLN